VVNGELGSSYTISYSIPQGVERDFQVGVNFITPSTGISRYDSENGTSISGPMPVSDSTTTTQSYVLFSFTNPNGSAVIIWYTGPPGEPNTGLRYRPGRGMSFRTSTIGRGYQPVFNVLPSSYARKLYDPHTVHTMRHHSELHNDKCYSSTNHGFQPHNLHAPLLQCRTGDVNKYLECQSQFS
jgi:hypothetical protein